MHKEIAGTEDEILSTEWHISPDSVAAFRRLAKTLKEDFPALVFVNSRSTAETVSQRLRKIMPDLEIGVHHGSLAAEDSKRCGKIIIEW